MDHTAPQHYLHMSSLVMATAMSYTGSRLSRKRYFPMSVRAEAASIASLPTLFLSRYGVASRPCKTKIYQCESECCYARVSYAIKNQLVASKARY